MPEHVDISTGEIHIAHNYSYADAAAREGASSFVSADLGKIARQTDNNSYWVLTATTPVWVRLDVGAVVNAQTGTSYTILAKDRGKLVTHTNASAIAVTLPVASTTAFGADWYVWIQNRGAGVVTITPTTSTIDGAASITLAQNEGVLIVSDGTNYFTVRGKGPGGGAGGYAASGANADITSMTGLTGAIKAPTQVQDSNSNEVLVFGSTASAVNEVKITNKATGTGPTIEATGNDTNINLNLVSKGTGVVQANGNEVAIKNAEVNAQTGTTYTLVASDNGKVVTLNNAAAITLTVPSGLGAGFNCLVVQLGAGQVTFSPSSTTINNRQSHTKIAGQYGVASLVAYAANTFALGGDTAA